jgi:ketopantoate hydroxymethyltransferase
MKAQDMAPVAWDAMVASALKEQGQYFLLVGTSYYKVAYDVWSSLLPLHMTTSAGDVLVRLDCS